MPVAPRPSSVAPIPLSYGAVFPRLPLITRILLICAVLLTIAAAIVVVRQTIPRIQRLAELRSVAAQRQALFSKCASYQYSPNTLIFDETTDPVPDPDYAGFGQTQTHALRVPRPPAGSGDRPADYPSYTKSWYWTDRRNDRLSSWNELACFNGRIWRVAIWCEHGLRPTHMYNQRGPSGMPDWADEVFVHALSRPDGRQRLAVIGFDAPAFVFGALYPFRTQVVEMTTWNRPLAVTASKDAHQFAFNLPIEQPLKLYAGQADPADPTHFTIAYETPAGRGTIDGYLQDDDTVRMQLRDGPAR